MELSPWEAASCVATQELPSNLWNPKVYYLSWARSIQSIPPPPRHPSSLSSILILFTHLRLCLPSGIFPIGIPPLPIRATCPAHLILLDLIILIYLAESTSYEASHYKVAVLLDQYEPKLSFSRKVWCRPLIRNLIEISSAVYQGRFNGQNKNDHPRDLWGALDVMRGCESPQLPLLHNRRLSVF
jgi:hypothetical protein